MDSKDTEIRVLDGWIPATKTHPACTIHEDWMWLPLWLDFKNDHIRTPTPAPPPPPKNGEPKSYSWGRRRRRKRICGRTAVQRHISSSSLSSWDHLHFLGYHFGLMLDSNRGRYHGGWRPSSDDSFHSPTVNPPSAHDKPSIMKRYIRRRTTRWGVTARSPTMVTLHDSRFVKCRWWIDGWTVKTVVTWRSSASLIPAPGHRPGERALVWRPKYWFDSFSECGCTSVDDSDWLSPAEEHVWSAGPAGMVTCKEGRCGRWCRRWRI